MCEDYYIYNRRSFSVCLPHPVAPKRRLVRKKNGKDERCSAWRDNPQKIVSFAVTCLGSSSSQQASPYFLHPS
jgi:hypothetical protein